MTCLLRVDHRLAHGAIWHNWVPYLEATCILIASDRLMEDFLLQTVIKSCKPARSRLLLYGVKESVDLLNSGVLEGEAVLLLTDTVQNACLIAIDARGIGHVNIGSLPPRAGALQAGPQVFLTKQEKEFLMQLSKSGITVDTRYLPGGEHTAWQWADQLIPV